MARRSKSMKAGMIAVVAKGTILRVVLGELDDCRLLNLCVLLLLWVARRIAAAMVSITSVSISRGGSDDGRAG